MKFATALAALVAFNSTAVMAAPCNNSLNAANLQTAVTGNWACDAGITWNEQHVGGASGSIIDYKKGPGPGPDPTSTVGTYSITTDASGNGLITYAYTSGGVYSYNVKQNGGSGNYVFCRVSPGGADLNITIKSSHC